MEVAEAWWTVDVKYRSHLTALSQIFGVELVSPSTVLSVAGVVDGWCAYGRARRWRFAINEGGDSWKRFVSCLTPPKRLRQGLGDSYGLEPSWRSPSPWNDAVIETSNDDFCRRRLFAAEGDW